METSDLFVKFVYDDSVLSSRLEDSDEKLKEHDELIKELQNKIANLPTNSQLEFMRDSIVKDFEKQINEMNTKYQNLLNQYNSMSTQIKNLSDTTDSKINALTEYIDNKVQQNYDTIMSATSGEHSRFDSIDDRINECLNKVRNQKSDLNDFRSIIQIIASSIAGFNDSDVSLDRNLQGHLKSSVNYVKYNIQKIHEDLARLKNAPPPITTKTSLNDTLAAILQQQNQTSNRSQSSTQKPSILSPHVTKPGKNISSPQIQKPQSSQQTPSKDQPLQQLQPKDQISGSNYDSDHPTETEKETKTDEPIPTVSQPPESEQPHNPPPKENISNITSPSVTFSTSNKPTKPPTTTPATSTSTTNITNNNPQTVTTTLKNFVPYDLNKVRPYSDFQVHWHDKPKLPEIRPFITIEDVVDHVYKMQPYLQAYLSAMHGKLIESWTQIQQKADKELVEKMFERMQNIVAEMNSSLRHLKDEIQQTATRKEINGFVDELMKSMRADATTAVGRVRCIACGRETAQITGAMTEAEVARSLGTNTPNSLVRGMANHKAGVAYSSLEGFDSAIVEEPRSKRPPQSQQIPLKNKAKFQ